MMMMMHLTICICRFTPKAYMYLQAVKNDGQTALHEAAEAGQTDTVQYLLSIGANTQAQDEVSYPDHLSIPFITDPQFFGPSI